MARRLGRRKRPTREKHMLKEQNKIEEGVFDNKTMMFLSKFFNKKVVEKLEHIIARGKEADVYLASGGESELLNGDRFVAVKFFRVETSSFLKMADYVVGDTRFAKAKITKSSIVKTWCRKEMNNLQIAQRSGINAPRPYMSNGSILAMEFIGNEDGVSAPQLRFVTLENPDRILDTVIRQMQMLYENKLVHADLSEYNILYCNDKPFFIDFGQAVILRHPNAQMFLERDVRNVLHYFSRRYKIERDYEQTLKLITQ